MHEPDRSSDRQREVSGPHLAGSSSCSWGRLGPSGPVEVCRPLHGGVPAPVEEHVGVAGHHLALLHHGDGAVVKQTPACRDKQESFAVRSTSRGDGRGRCWATLTNVTALTVLVTGQPSVGGVVAPDHPAVVVDDRVQVIHGLLHLILHADAEPAQVQVPGIRPPAPAEATEKDAWMTAAGREHLPDGKVDHVVDFVPPDEAPEGEALELDDEHVGQAPQQQLLGGFSVLLTLGTVPSGHRKSGGYRSLRRAASTRGRPGC